MTLDVEPEDVLGVGLRVVCGGGVLHATGLAAAADLDLGLDHDRLADFLRDLAGTGDSVGNTAGDVGTSCLAKSSFA